MSVKFMATTIQRLVGAAQVSGHMSLLRVNIALLSFTAIEFEKPYN